MPSEVYVLDEWALHDLAGENGTDRQSETFGFLEKLVEKCDRIAVLRASKWAEKSYELMSQTKPPVREMSKFLHRSILLNPRKCIQLDPSETASLQLEVEAIPADDRYLFETAQATRAKAIVTTDTRLIQRAAGLDLPFVVLPRDQFLQGYG